MYGLEDAENYTQRQEIRKVLKQERETTKRDIEILLDYMRGYIDDELGGFEEDSEHTKIYYQIKTKYGL